MTLEILEVLGDKASFRRGIFLFPHYVASELLIQLQASLCIVLSQVAYFPAEWSLSKSLFRSAKYER